MKTITVCDRCGKRFTEGHKCPKWRIVLRQSVKKPITDAVFHTAYKTQKTEKQRPGNAVNRGACGVSETGRSRWKYNLLED